MYLYLGMDAIFIDYTAHFQTHCTPIQASNRETPLGHLVEESASIIFD